jgi:hypothetical protein
MHLRSLDAWGTEVLYGRWNFDASQLYFCLLKLKTNISELPRPDCTSLLPILLACELANPTYTSAAAKTSSFLIVRPR